MNKSFGRLACLKKRLDCIDKPQWRGSSNLKYTWLQREALSSPVESSGELPSLESMATGSHRMFYKERGCKAGIRASEESCPWSSWARLLRPCPVWAVASRVHSQLEPLDSSLWRGRAAVEGRPMGAGVQARK